MLIPFLELDAPISGINTAITKTFERFQLKPTLEQMESIYHSVVGKDVFLAIPTGSGKSFCYGLLPKVYTELCALFRLDSKFCIVVVISPLLSLMQDQILKFNSMNIAAAYVGCDAKTNNDITSGMYEIVFTSPENCLKYQEVFISSVYQDHLCCIAVDEAHCIEKW